MRETGSDETVVPVTHVDSYADPVVKKLMHEYKFSTGWSERHMAAHRLEKTLTDICIDTMTKPAARTGGGRTVVVFTCPPSTMHARKEKLEDSMWLLLRRCGRSMPFYFNAASNKPAVYTRVFAIKSDFLLSRRAQHIGGSRKSRTANIHDRYAIRLTFKVHLSSMIRGCEGVRHISFRIIDDVASTGGTLLACSETLQAYMQILQRKNPRLSFDIGIFSIAH